MNNTKLSLFVIFGVFAVLYGCSASSPQTTTTTCTTTTTSSSAIIRLYYTYPTDASKKDKSYDSQNFGSAYSSDGINFTQDSGARLGPLANLSDPDVIKESSGHWALFYSKAVSSDPEESANLFKATCSTPDGTFSADSSFTGGELGNLSSSIKIGDTYYVYVVSNGIKICTYDPSANSLTLAGTGPAGAVDPSVIQLSSSSFKMYYKLSGDTYCAGSSDGLSWGEGTKIVSYAEVPGAIYVNNKIYLYYTNSNTNDANNGKTMVIISSDDGATFSSAEVVSGLADAACDPDPVAYE